jgi:hypothetical protein
MPREVQLSAMCNVQVNIGMSLCTLATITQILPQYDNYGARGWGWGGQGRVIACYYFAKCHNF